MEEWEELLHPGPQRAFYPTLPHDATPIPHFSPPSDQVDVIWAPNPLPLLGFRRWDAVGDHGRPGACGVAERARATALADLGPFRPRDVLRVGRGGRSSGGASGGVSPEIRAFKSAVRVAMASPTSFGRTSVISCGHAAMIRSKNSASGVPGLLAWKRKKRAAPRGYCAARASSETPTSVSDASSRCPMTSR